MITSGYKTSLLVPSQLPEYIRDNPDYDKFVLFLKAYYEWMEQNGNVTERTKNLLKYKDIDQTSSEFLQYFINDFLPYFPKDALIDEATAIKAAKQLYSAKGTPSSYKFLFKILYNSDFDYYYTKDFVFRASAGEWYVARSLKLATSDTRFLSIKNYRIFGESSKSIATIENVIRAGNKVEVFISDIQRLFESGEFVRVVDANNQDVLVNGQILRSKIVGQISQIRIDPNRRGLFYKSGDPVIVYDGLNPDVPNAKDAVAQVGTTTTGTIQNINVLTGGFGYTEHPNTTINILNGGGAAAIVGSVDPDVTKRANVAFISVDSIDAKKSFTIGAADYAFSGYPNANANTTLQNALTFRGFSTFPISSVLLLNGGGNIQVAPTVSATSRIQNDANTFNDLASLGMLGPIQIASGGLGYQANDVIIFTGGSGYGAYANVKTVNASGTITSVEYVYKSDLYPPGGLGYTSTTLPTLTVQSANVAANGASLFVPGIIGDGATFQTVVDRIGAISTINILDGGEDYVSRPNVSLKIQDIVVTNVSVSLLPEKNDIVFQGPDLNTSTYRATVNNVTLLASDANSALSKYNLRVFEYNSNPDTTKTLKIDGKNINLLMANSAFDSNYNSSGVRTYGDGRARANATFLNGLVISAGEYLNKRGQPSSYDVLQSLRFNDYTYQITVEKEISKYREILLNLLHPTGTQLIGRYQLKSNTEFSKTVEQALTSGHTLYYYTNDASSNAVMQAAYYSGNNKFALGSNVIKFNNIGGGTNIADFIFANSIIILSSGTGPNVKSQITSVDYANDQITIADTSLLTYANVARGTGTAGTNTINITEITNAYSIMNGGVYSNTSNFLRDIMFAGDRIIAGNNTPIEIQSINYETKVITLKSNLANTTNSLLTVSRTFTAGGTVPKANEIKIMGPIGIQYFPELITESGNTITTESGSIILLG
jgi:hypothetical protein